MRRVRVLSFAVLAVFAALSALVPPTAAMQPSVPYLRERTRLQLMPIADTNVNEIQDINVTATSGTFKLRVPALLIPVTTEAITVPATAADVQVALLDKLSVTTGFTDEKQLIKCENTGTFTLTFDGQGVTHTTAAIAHNAAAATVKTALEALSNIPNVPSSVVVTGSPGEWTVTFTAQLTLNFRPLTVGTTTGTAAVTVTPQTSGVHASTWPAVVVSLAVSGDTRTYTVVFSGANMRGAIGVLVITGTGLSIAEVDEVQTVSVAGTSGSFTLTFDTLNCAHCMLKATQTTGALTMVPTATTVKTALELLTNIDSVTVTRTSEEWTQLGLDIDGEATLDESGFRSTMNTNGNIVAIGAYKNDGTASAAGHVRVYIYSGHVWTQLGSDIDGDAVGDFFGLSVALNGDGTIVAGGATDWDASGGDNNGLVRVYTYTGSQWTQLGLDISGATDGDKLGMSVALNTDGTVVACGSTTGHSNKGYVRVYTYNTATQVWDLKGSQINGQASSDAFGISVALSGDGDRIAIGANGHNGDKGTVQVYAYSVTWGQLGGDIDGEAAGDTSGDSLAMNDDGTIVAIGATLNDGGGTDSGHVRVWKFTTATVTWTQKGIDIDGENAGDFFGVSVALDSAGGTVVIGANGYSSDTGYSQIWDYVGSAWQQRGTTIAAEAAADRSGQSVSINDDGFRVAIGAHTNDGGGTDAGHVRIFDWTDAAHQYVYFITFSGSNVAGDLPALEIDGTNVVLSTTTPEVQTVVITATSGSFTLAFYDHVTTAIAVGALAATVEAALEGLTAIPSCTVNGHADNGHVDTYAVTFSDAANAGPLAPDGKLVVDTANLNHAFGVGATVTVTTPGVTKTTSTGTHTHGVATKTTQATTQNGLFTAAPENPSNISMEFSLRYDYSSDHKTWTFALPGVGSILAAGEKPKKLTASKLSTVGLPTQLEYMYVDTYDEAYYKAFYPGCLPLVEPLAGDCGYSPATKVGMFASVDGHPAFSAYQNGRSTKGGCFVLPYGFSGQTQDIWDLDNIFQFSVSGTKFAVQLRVTGQVENSPPSRSIFIDRPTFRFGGWSDYPRGVEWAEEIPYEFDGTNWIIGRTFDPSDPFSERCLYPVSDGENGFFKLCGLVTGFVTSDETFRWPYAYNGGGNEPWGQFNCVNALPTTTYPRFYNAIFKNVGLSLLEWLGQFEAHGAFPSPLVMPNDATYQAPPGKIWSSWSLYGKGNGNTFMYPPTTLRTTFDDVRKVLWVLATNDRTGCPPPGCAAAAPLRPDLIMTLFFGFSLDMSLTSVDLYTGAWPAPGGKNQTTKGPILQFKTSAKPYYCGGEWEMAVHDGAVVLSRLDGLVEGTTTNLVYTHADEFSCEPNARFDQVRPKLSEIQPGHYRAQMEYVDVPLDDDATGDDDGIPGGSVGLMDVPNIRDGFTAMTNYYPVPYFFTNARINETCTQACMNFAGNDTAMQALNGVVTLFTNEPTLNSELQFAKPHGFAVGDAIVYNKNTATAIPELTDDTTYYVAKSSAVVLPDRMRLALTYAKAIVNDQYIFITNGGAGNKVTWNPLGATLNKCMTHAVQESAILAIYGNMSCMIPPTTRTIHEMWTSAGNAAQVFTKFYPTSAPIADWLGIYADGGSTYTLKKCIHGATGYANCVDLFAVSNRVVYLVYDTTSANSKCSAFVHPESGQLSAFTNIFKPSTSSIKCGTFVTRMSDYVYVANDTVIAREAIHTGHSSVCGDGTHCGGAKFTSITSFYGHGQYIYLIDNETVRYYNTHSERVWDITSNWTLSATTTTIYADDWFIYLRASTTALVVQVYYGPTAATPNTSTFVTNISLESYTGAFAMANDHLYVLQASKSVVRAKSPLSDTSECFDMGMHRNVETPIGAICICGDGSESDVLTACPAEAHSYANGTVEPNTTYRWRTHPAAMVMGEFYSHRVNRTDVAVFNDCRGVCAATGASCVETLDLTGSDLTLFNDLYGINCDDRMEDVFRLGQFGYEKEQDVCFGIVNSRQCGPNTYNQYSDRGDFYYCCCGDAQSLDCAGYAPGSTRTMYVPFVNRTCHGVMNLTHVKHVECPIADLDPTDHKFVRECECENMCDAEPGCTGYNLHNNSGHLSCSFYGLSITMTNTSNVECYCNSQAPGCQTHYFDPQTPSPTVFPTIPPLDPAEVAAMDRAMMFKPSLPPSLAPTTTAPTPLPTVYVPTAAPFKGHLPTVAKIPNFWIWIVIVAILACAVAACIAINAFGKGKCCLWLLRKCPNATYCVACVVPAYICCAACRDCVPEGCRKVDWDANYCIFPGLAPEEGTGVFGEDAPLTASIVDEEEANERDAPIGAAYINFGDNSVSSAPDRWTSTRGVRRRRATEYRVPYLKIE